MSTILRFRIKRKPSPVHDDHQLPLQTPAPEGASMVNVPAESCPPTKHAAPAYMNLLNSNPTKKINSTVQKPAFNNPTSRPTPGASQYMNNGMKPGSFKTCSILEKLIDSGAVSNGASVSYLGKRHKSALKEGKITRQGILCSCCGHVFFLSKFEAHAGSSMHRPAANLFLTDGRSLQDCQQQATGNYTAQARRTHQWDTAHAQCYNSSGSLHTDRSTKGGSILCRLDSSSAAGCNLDTLEDVSDRSHEAAAAASDQMISTVEMGSTSYEHGQAKYAATDESANYNDGDINTTCRWMDHLGFNDIYEKKQEAGSNTYQTGLFPLVADTSYSLEVDESFLQGPYQYDSNYEALSNGIMQQDNQQENYTAQMESEPAARAGFTPHVNKQDVMYSLQRRAEADVVCKNIYIPEKQGTMLLKEDHGVVSTHDDWANNKVFDPVQYRPADLYDGVSREQGTSTMKGRVDRAGALPEKGTHSPAINDTAMVSTTDDDGHDDVCRICRDGGELIMCDGCPSSFHVECVRLDSIPQGDWYCSECTCAKCGLAAGKDPPQSQRPEAVLQQDNTVHETRSDMICCPHCQLWFHKRCVDGGQYSIGNHIYCSKACLNVSTKLRSLVGRINPLPGGLSWTLIRSFKEEYTGQPSKLQVSFDKQLHKALKLLQQSFHHIKDDQTGIEMLAQTVFNKKSDVQRLDCSRFYTVLLCKGEQLVSAASVRPRGSIFAEMPFIATSYRFRRKGMCKVMMREVEGLLRGVGISELVIPAVNDLLSMWTGPAFNFKFLVTSQEPEGKRLLKRMGGMHVMFFPGTTLLHKNLQKTSSQAIHDDEANYTGGVQLHQSSESLSKAGRHDQQLSQINDLNNKTVVRNSPFSQPAAGAAAHAVNSRAKLQISRRALQVTSC